MTGPDGRAELTCRVERAEAAARCSLDRLASAPGDAFEQFGAVTAFVSRSTPNTFFNRAIGMCEADADRAPAIAAWFRERGVPPRFDVAPPRAGSRLRSALRAVGCAPETMQGLTRRLMAGPVELSALGANQNADGIVIVEADGSRLEDFLDIQMHTWPEDGGTRAEWLERLRRTAAAPGLTRFVALVDGRPVATAGLHVIDGVAWLNSGATLAAFRGRGIQTALIRHRLAIAHRLGADLAGSLVAPGSPSERNLRRCGLKPLCDRELWLPPDWTDHRFYRDADR